MWSRQISSVNSPPVPNWLLMDAFRASWTQALCTAVPHTSLSTSIVVTGQALAPTHTVGERLPVSPRLLSPLVSALHVPKCTYNISHMQWMEKSYCFGMYVAAATATPSPNLIVRSAAPSGVRHAIFELPGLSSCH